MGVSDSVILKPHFKEISASKWTRTVEVLEAYKSEGYDFGIDIAAIMKITGLSSEKAKALLQAHTSKSDVSV
jgi:hypothetical protein